MTARILESALAMSATGELRVNCSTCTRRKLCQRIHEVIRSLQKQEGKVWDIEHRIRFKHILSDLVSMGFEYPDGMERCDVSHMDRSEIMVILHGAQQLLLEVKCGR